MATAKKTSKKTAKKNYPSKKLPKLKSMTLEEFMAVTAENHAKMATNHAKTEAAIAENNAKMAENHAKTEAAIDRLSAENRETAKVLQETLRSVDRMSDKVDMLSDNLGYVNNRIGRIVELVVAPKIRLDINAQGHNFDHLKANKMVRGNVDGRTETIAEVDVLLSSPTEVMAIEIKTRLKESHVNDHLDRLQDLRKYEEEAEIMGKKLFGAVGGVVVDYRARELAKKNGLYVFEIREEENKLKIEKPESCRTW